MGVLGSSTIDDYIRDRFEDIGESNACEHRPTYKKELDAEEKRCRELYKRGEKFVSGISKDDLVRCKRLYIEENKGDYRVNDLVEVRTKDGRVIIPRYVSLIEKVTKLKEVLA